MTNMNGSIGSNDDLNENSSKNVGILAVEVYTPRTYIQQSELEQHSNVASGKYTIGLGQVGLAITGDAEDINSICLTVVASLLEKYDIDPMTVGRLEVGTETLIDKSKSTKTVLMDLFPNNTDIEGATVINACYGGTAALLNAFLWCESSGWDGRYAIVVAADIATYERGPARPTCGCGAVAVLVGRDAPLSFNPKDRATHASNVWDFFKPNHAVEYPVVDGALSQTCYYQALEDTYDRFVQKMIQNHPPASRKADSHSSTDTDDHFTCESPDYFVFHAPYNKLVQKSYARLYLCDARRRYKTDSESSSSPSSSSSYCCEEKKAENGNSLTEDWLTKPIKETYNDKVLDDTLKRMSAASFKKRLVDANAASQLIGNTYTASVFVGLASLIDRAGTRGDLLPGMSIVLFSYGSGALATMYRLQVRQPSESKFTIENIARVLDLTNRLAQREVVHPSELDLALETRARMHLAGAPYTPVYPTVGRLFPGTFYLKEIDSKWRRTYDRVPFDAPLALEGTELAPLVVKHLAVTDADSQNQSEQQSKENTTTSTNVTGMRIGIPCVITGTAAGLPGAKDVFRSDNLDRLIAGDQCIFPIPPRGITALLEKNVIETKKLSNGAMKRVHVNNESEVIKLAAQLGDFCLTTSYGVPEGLAKTMDVAAQVAVAAGLEALKNAGLVSGKSNDPKEWMLPDAFRDSTGVVYASSFPAMDAAVGEVMRFLQSRTVSASDSTSLVQSLRSRFLRSAESGALSDDDEAAFARLLVLAEQNQGSTEEAGNKYEFDRKFLFRVLVLGNAQLAQLCGARGPNTQTNAACAGTTQAIAMAQDMLSSGRAQRVVVVAGDNASGETLLPWLGSGFRALGAACTKDAVEDAAMPFDKRRSGLLLGAGGIGLVLETEQSVTDRTANSLHPFEIKARLLATQYSNSAFHGAALDRKHIASELNRFLNDIELTFGINKTELATKGVYFSHETSTHASDASSCSGNEVAALRSAFGDELLSKLLICNTKGFTGHPMGVSFEDVAAVEVLFKQIVPPIPNYKEEDEYLGKLNISLGGTYSCRYALRFAAGFGSQVAFALYSIA